ncbi:MAG: disulfide bond formation protein DsbD [Bacteroidetes bacterium]|nr:MAG: disulfide bond formation protein DsbD [Bacteroidota bacterium]
MKKFLSIALLALGWAAVGQAQVADPVSWNFSVENIKGLEAELVFKASIDLPWHMYSAHLPEGGPIATRPWYSETDGYELIGDLVEVTKSKRKFDEGFQMELGTFSGRAELRQKVRLNAAGSLSIKGEIEYQVCNDVTCLPPRTQPFSFVLNTADEAARGQRSAGPGTPENQQAAAGDSPAPGNLVQHAGEDAGRAFEAEAGSASVLSEAGAESQSGVAAVPALEDEASLWGFFWLAFGLGLLALLTPCVFPMIPMTVSFFMQGADNKARGFFRGLVFGISIVAIYTALGLLVSISNVGPNAANALSTHWIPNLIFFVLFVVFAFSFFGMFELVLPSSWVNKADSRVQGGGFGGAFFMALTTVLVSFSCTGPIVGALLVEAAGGLALKPILGMFGFGLAFAIPFTLFAMFPSWLKGLPKSGAWLNAVKVVLGFIVLAFSMKFLLALDPTNKVLTRELYLAVWLVVFFLLGMYFLGKIRFSHDSELEHVSVPRLLLAIATFSFVVYLFLGLFGYELKRISPLLPPKSPNGIDLTQRLSAARPPAATPFLAEQAACIPKKHADLFHMPFGLTAFYDLEEGLACAKASGKPVLIDFKGHFCSNCKKMEAGVWSDSRVLALLRNEFVIVALYTDDRTKLPEQDWYVSEVDGREKKTIGQQNIDYEIARFGTNTVPLYVLMDADGKVLNSPKGTDLDVQSYLSWMKEAL